MHEQSSVLAQIGVLDVEQLSATGLEAGSKVMDPAPSNALIMRRTKSKG